MERAEALANNNQAQLTVVDIVDHIPSTPHFNHLDLQSKIIANHQLTLTEICDKTIKVQSKVLIGKPFLEIIREVIRNGYDLVNKNLGRKRAEF